MSFSSSSLLRSHSPTEGSIIAAEELELDIEQEHDVLEHGSPSLTKDLPHPLQAAPSDSLPGTVRAVTPSKVKAAAALWEKSAPVSSPNSIPRQSPSSSFRSIPPSSSKNTLGSKHASPEKLSILQPPFDLHQHPFPTSVPQAPGSPITATPSHNPFGGLFAEVPLEDTSPATAKASAILHSTSIPQHPDLPLAELSTSYPEIDVAPCSQELQPLKSSFFSSALGFGLPSSSPASSSSQPSTAFREASSCTAPSTSAGPGWRSTMSNILGTRSLSATASTPSSTSPAYRRALSPADDVPRNHSTSFLLQRMASPTASRDRRISREVGAADKLREGFERVRLEMEGAARDMRREEQQSGSPVLGDTAGVDWAFWGAVVQDYEEVARTRPKDLSKAIQQGIPAVIRGAIWQLMSSSKSAPLEETYKALLKLPSTHEKAIVKDLSRTFPNHEFFQENGGLGQESLFMVVKAYSLYDQEVGYTQGLAFIVAALLLNMPDEEAFCVLVRLMESYNLRSHFLADMPGLQLRLFQFDRLVEEILPLTHTHFMKKGIKSSMFASQWFMTLFSYRFPLSLVYRVLDIVFAEGIEAIFRFSLALLRKSEDKLVGLDFEQILTFLQTDLFEVYRIDQFQDDVGNPDGTEGWRANDFVRDAYEVRITPFMLDSYESEYEEQCRRQNRHALELDQLRNANRNLSNQVKQLEASLATMNHEHVDIVRQLVMTKIEKEESEAELVRYKMLYAELAHAQQDALSTHSRFSGTSNNQSSGKP